MKTMTDEELRKRLKLYVVTSHVDKPLTDIVKPSVFEVPIQAGAALTDKRVTEINDLDDCPDNISDRNERYCECTAMWWVGKHIDSQYIGIMHYRRRLDISDEEYISYMDQGVDIITMVPDYSDFSQKDLYLKVHFSSDWDLFMDILREQDPKEFEYYRDCFDSHYYYRCNINVFKAELYKEYCEWAFPILDEFYRRSPVKTDVYHRRDVGFIAECVSHLFVVKKIRDGYNVVEAPLKELGSRNKMDDERDYSDMGAMYNLCNELYGQNHIHEMELIIKKTLECNENLTDSLLSVYHILIVGIVERSRYRLSLYEYLPIEFRCDLDTIISTWNTLVEVVRSYAISDTPESEKLLSDYINMTGFSEAAVEEAVDMLRGN